MKTRTDKQRCEDEYSGINTNVSLFAGVGYTFLGLAGIVIFFLVMAMQNNNWVAFFSASLVMLVPVGVGIGQIAGVLRYNAWRKRWDARLCDEVECAQFGLRNFPL